MITAKEAANTIYSEMNSDDIEKYKSEGWREGVQLMLRISWMHLRPGDVLTILDDLCYRTQG